MKNVFLTGATGFLGGEVAVALSKNESIDKIFCLVRAKCCDEASERLRGVFALHSDEFDTNRVIAVAGDLTDERLTEQLEGHACLEQTNLVVHAGANTSFLPQKYPQIEETNVKGTERLLEWASRLSALQQFAYVGTATIVGGGPDAVGRTVYEDESPNPTATHLVGYTRSKALAETAVRRTIPPEKLLIVRPSILLGDTRCLVPRSYDIAWIIIAIKSLRMFFGNPDAACDIIPVDYAANAIVELIHAARRYTTYHVSAGRTSTTCRQIGETCHYADTEKLPVAFCSRGELDLLKRWLRSTERPDPALDRYSEYLEHINYGVGKKKTRMLLSGLEAYWQFIDTDQRFDNARLLSDTRIGLPEPAHEYIARTARFLEDLDPITAAVNP